MRSIVHVITGLEAGGAEALLADLVERSDRDRFTHQVVSLLPGGAVRPRIEQAGVPVADLGMRHARPSLTALLELRRRIRESRAEVVHAWMYHACVAATLATVGTRQSRLLWGLHSANIDQSQFPVVTQLVIQACRWLDGKPQAVVVNSGETRNFHRDLGLNPKRWVLVPNGIDTTRFKPDAEARAAVRASLGISEDAPLIGFIARRDPQKDHVTFLRAAEQLAARRPGAQFLLAGLGTGPDEPKMRDALQRHAPHATMHLLGLRRDVPAITAALDVATVCSFGESFSNTLVEAMACGVPCVVTDVAPLPEILDGGGAVVPIGDPDTLAAAWDTLLAEDPRRRQARGEAARRRVRGEFSVELMVRRLEDLYHE